MLVHHAQAPESESEQVSQSRFTNASRFVQPRSPQWRCGRQPCTLTGLQDMPVASVCSDSDIPSEVSHSSLLRCYKADSCDVRQE